MSSRLVEPVRADRVVELRARDHLALADQLFVSELGLLASQPLGQHVVLAALGPRQGHARGRALPRLAELGADRVDGLLGHQPEGGQLAAGDRHEPADAVALGVIEQRVGASHVARIRI